MMSLSSLGILFLNKKKKEPVVFLSLARSILRRRGGLDQQPADWSSITTSVQTPSGGNANFPFLAQCGGSRDAVEHVSVGVCPQMLMRYLAFKRTTSIIYEMQLNLGIFKGSA